MKLDEWVDAEGPGATHRLSIESKVAYTTVLRVIEASRKGEPNASTKAARKLVRGTKGAVSIAELRLPDDELVRLGLRAPDAERRRRKRDAA